MKNYETEAAWKYHNGTRHPDGTLLSRYHSYDPASRPFPYKIYETRNKINLVLGNRESGISTLEAISNNAQQTGECIPDINTLSRVLFLSGGITKALEFGPPLGRVEFRAASCTGALYHIEIYVSCTDVQGLNAGIYHYDPMSNSLTVLKDGDYRNEIAEATANEAFTSHSAITLIFTDVFARNAIKYQAREYRHAFWDCGTIISNCLAATTAYKIPYKLILGFVDSTMNELLGLDQKEESAIAILSLGRSEHDKPVLHTQHKIPKARPLGYHMDLAAINEIHNASSLTSIGEVEEWRARSGCEKGQLFSDFPEQRDEAHFSDRLERTIIRRGSTRVFSHEAISSGQLSAILRNSTRGIISDFTGNVAINDIYLIANAVDGLESGAYHYNMPEGSFDPLRLGSLRETSGHLGLDQRLAHDASAVLFFMADLRRVLGTLGNRGYRAAQLEASIMAGKMYLASYSLNLGATGLTFYDEDVTEFFSPHAKDKNSTFVLAIGKKSDEKLRR